MPKGIPKNGINNGQFKKGNLFGKRFQKGIIPKTAIKKGEHRGMKTEFKKGGIAPMKGRKQSEEIKQNLREKLKGKHLSLNTEFKKGHLISIEVKKKISKWQINNPNRKFKDTSIELKVEAELQRRNINYQKQVPLCNIAIVDFYLPEYRIVIQCDGDYWHNLSGSKERDEKQDKVLIFNGFNVYRFWEYEINKSIEKCINKINLC